MRASSRVRGSAAAGAVLLLTAVLVFVSSACGGYVLPLPPTAEPSLPAGSSRQPALSYPAQRATTEQCAGCSEGWFFQPVRDIEVTALGYYDDGRDGLLHPHRCAIFDVETRRAVAETVIQPQSPLAALFRWEPVGPVVLEAGRHYVMLSSGERPFDPQVTNPAGVSLAPAVQYLGYRETRGTADPAWGFPDRIMGDARLSGNFLYRTLRATD